MKNIEYLESLIIYYGRAFYGSKTPKYMASQWAKALPETSLSDFNKWFDRGFWDPDIARALSDAGVSPLEVPLGTAYDLCNGDLSVATFLQARGC